MKMKQIYSLGLIALLFSFVGCSDPWDEHIKAGQSDINQSLLQRLEAEADASVFLGLLREADLGSTLQGDNAYTVFAPSNASLQSLATSLREDREALNNFVKNHIAVSTHRQNNSADTIQLTMLNGKILDLVASRIGGVTFSKPNQGAADGLYHVIAGPLMPQQNLWEYISSSDYVQNRFVLELNDYTLYGSGEEEDPADSLLNNELLHHAGDFRVEKDRFTYFVLPDALFDQETTGFLPYVNYKNEADSSVQISRYHVVRDLIFPQAYDKDDLPDELISVSGVRFPVNKNAIVETIALSNGYVHILNAPTLPLVNKLVDVIVEGEEPTSFSNNVPANIFHRVRRDPDGVLFTDIMVQNHGISMFSIDYQLDYFYSTTYDVYWRALNDIQSNVFPQRVGIGGMPELNEDDELERPILHMFPYIDVQLNNYNEVFVGTFELNQFRQIVAGLIANNVTTNGNNTLVLDYLRFVPKLK